MYTCLPTHSQLHQHVHSLIVFSSCVFLLLSLAFSLSHTLLHMFMSQAHVCIHDAGLPHPPSLPHPMVSPLACQAGSCLVWPCCFPRLVLFGLVPSPPVEWGLWSFWLAPPRHCGGSVFYRGMVWLLPLVSSNVIVTCLVPSPPCGVGPVVVLVGPAPPVWGSAFYRDMVWLLRLLAVMSSLRAPFPYKI